MAPKLSQNQMSELTETYKIKVVQLHYPPQRVIKPYPNPKNSPLGPRKFKNYPKIKQKQISDITETYKMKVVQLYE